MANGNRPAGRTGNNPARIPDQQPEWLRQLTVKRKDIDVLLLNAHGGINPADGEYVTPGKRSPVWDDKTPVHGENIYYEGVGSRAVNKKIKEALEYLGISVRIVNDTWEDTPIHMKRAMVKALINSGIIDPAKTLALEPHNNGTKEMLGKAHGIEVWTLPGQSKSDLFATIVYDVIGEILPNVRRRTDYHRDVPGHADPDKEAKWGILKIDSLYGIPIILSEFFFMDNEAECRKYLMTDEGQSIIAMILVIAIVRFINQEF